MARTGMIRFGSALVVLTLAGAPASGAMIRYEFPRTFDVAPPAPAGPRVLGSLSFEDRAGRDDAPGRPAEGFVFDLALGGGSSGLPIGGRIPPHWILGEPTEADFHPLRQVHAAGVGRPWASADAAPSWLSADGPAVGAESDPPLALAAFLGVAAWAVHRRCTERRMARPGRARLAPPARPTGTAIVLASRPRRPAASTALVLPARFVEVSTTACAPALPAWGVGATSVALRRRAGARRILA